MLEINNRQNGKQIILKSNFKGGKKHSKVLPRIEINKDMTLWIEMAPQSDMKN